MQHMVPSFCPTCDLWQVLHVILYIPQVNHVLVILDHSPVHRVTVPYAAYIQCDLLKMSIYGSKHVEECNIICINNNLYIKLVINI